MHFSEAFGVTRDDWDDWFDPILTDDTKLFVDPFLIFQDEDSAWHTSHGDLIEYFDMCFRLIAEGSRNPNAVAYKKALSLLRFPEPREFCLGYSDSGTRGSGGGSGYARMIAGAMSDAILRGIEHLEHFEELGILNEGIGPDRISDLTCNMLRPRFIKYTQEIVERHSIPTKSEVLGGAIFDETRMRWRQSEVELPVHEATGRPVLLLPRRFLRELPVLNADDWWESSEAAELRNDVNYEVMGKVAKKDIVALARRHPESVRAWASKKEAAKASAYDFEKDPLGVVRWLREAQAFAQRNPLTVQDATNDDEFIAVINLVVEKFKLFVEQQGGWRLLWNDGAGSEKQEEAAQLLFKGIAKSYCESNGVVLDREVELGRGPVDFKFSSGYARRAHLEVKKLHNGKFWNGLEQQLPSYMTSDECDLGWFLAVQYRDNKSARDRARALPARVKRLAQAKNMRLRFGLVDGLPKDSASKL